MAAFEVRNPAFEARVREVFRAQTFMREIGAGLTSVSPGVVEIQLEIGDRLLQHHGFVHGAVIAAAVDTACGCAALTLMAPRSNVLTVEYKINFMAPAAGDLLIARGRVRRSGRMLSVCEGEALVASGGERKAVAALMATMARVAEDR